MSSPEQENCSFSEPKQTFFCVNKLLSESTNSILQYEAGKIKNAQNHRCISAGGEAEGSKTVISGIHYLYCQVMYYTTFLRYPGAKFATLRSKRG